MDNVMQPPMPADLVAVGLNDAARLGRAGMLVLALGVLPVGAWLAVAPLASAVVASAHVKIDLNRRPVQHTDGGIVREVRVRDGQRVDQGEPLLILGDVRVDADLSRLSYRVQAERASMARLQAESRMAPVVSFPPDVLKAKDSDPRLGELLDKERSLFTMRREAVIGQVDLLASQREKVLQEMKFLRAQIDQAGKSLNHQKADLEANRRLLSTGFISSNRIEQIEATVADYGARLEEKRSTLARTEQRVVEIDLRMRGLESSYQSEASDQLKIAAARLSEIEQELRKSTDASTRQVIVAPASGEVIDLKFTTPGGVVSPRETIANIVPLDSRLVVEARLRPEDISRVHPDQPADIRFTAFRYRTTLLVEGKVFYVSADRSVDPATDTPYYTALVEADQKSLEKAGNLKLQAGMPAEVYIKGEERTPLQYLVEPVTQVLRRAAREQ